MSSQVLAVELTSVAQEAKRKYPEIKTAADKSLADVKTIGAVSEQQLAIEISRRPDLIDPFILGLNSKNAKIASSSIICIQRLITIKGLPRTRLQEALDGFLSVCSLSLDVQLKILQSLPALVQNYAKELVDTTLAAALHVCAILLQAKVPTIAAVASATFQQLVVLVFDKVATDAPGTEDDPSSSVKDIQIGNETVTLHTAAYDGYRVFQDLCIATEGGSTNFLQLENFPEQTGLEIIYALFSAHGSVFASHIELRTIVRDDLLPYFIRLLSDRQSFAVTVRVLRLVPLLAEKHLRSMPEEFEILLGLLTHLLDPDSSPTWKRLLILEVWREIYSSFSLPTILFVQYDLREGHKAILRDNISSFVRLSTEKPVLLGLNQQSRASYDETRGVDAASIEATGGVGSIVPDGADEDVTDATDLLWSSPKVALIDTLDKSEAPMTSELYMFVLLMGCISGLSENLAKIILPLSVGRHAPNDRRPTISTPKITDDNHSSDSVAGNDTEKPTVRPRRAMSHRSSSVPINPLTLADSPHKTRIQAIAAMIDQCWPALLASSSSFLNAALPNNSYRSLIRSIQRFTQVAGLLDVSTARDAFMTALSRAAFPSNLLSSLTISAPQTPVTSSPSSFLNARNFLNIDGAHSAATMTSNAERRASVEPASLAPPTLRNLQCLRALINVAIALGSRLDSSISIILATLQQMDVFFDFVRQAGTGWNLAPLAQEIEAIAGASQRLLESIADYPNESFRHLLDLFSGSLSSEEILGSQSPRVLSRTNTGGTVKQKQSIIATPTGSSLHVRDQYILLSKLARITQSNVDRFTSYPPRESGWSNVLHTMLAIADDHDMSRHSRLLAVDTVCKCASSLCRSSQQMTGQIQENVQQMALESIRSMLNPLISEEHVPIQITEQGLQLVLDSIESVIDALGESLITGWDVVLLCVSSAFQRSESGDDDDDLQMPQTPSKSTGIAALPQAADCDSMRSIVIGRTAFAILQVLCNDFLRCINGRQLLLIPDLLLKFCRQDLDINMALTSITIFSTVSDFLLANTSDTRYGLLPSGRESRRRDGVILSIADTEVDNRGAHWLLLIRRLSQVALDDREDLRNSAFQTLLRILASQTFSAEVFIFIFDTVLLSHIRELLASARNEDGPGRIPDQGHLAHPALKMVILGTSKYVTGDLDITNSANFAEVTNKWLDMCREVIALDSYLLDEAVYVSLNTMLSLLSHGNADLTQTVSRCRSFWHDNRPKVKPDNADPLLQQAAYLAYLSCGKVFVKLERDSMATSDVSKLSSCAIHCVRTSLPEKYGADDKVMTKLQSSCFELVTSLSIKSDGSLVVVINAICELARLPFQSDTDGGATTTTKRLTFIAAGKACVERLAHYFERHSQRTEMYSSNVLINALDALLEPIELKYHWPAASKSPSFWRQATSSALTIITIFLQGVCTHKQGVSYEKDVVASQISRVTSAILQGDYSPIQIHESYENICMIEDDEEFDITSFLHVRDQIIALVSDSEVSSTVRHEFCGALYANSMIHTRIDSRRQNVAAENVRPLDKILSSALPTVQDVTLSRREDIGYLCIAELFNMTSEELPSDDVWPPSSTLPGTYKPRPAASDETAKDSHACLAGAAFPWLVARIGLTLKNYIADQPLRGSLPGPRSVVEELVWLVERTTRLKCHSAAISMTVMENLGADDDLCRSLRSAQGSSLAVIRVLHPLLIKAVKVAAHGLYGNKEILHALMACLDVFGSEQ